MENLQEEVLPERIIDEEYKTRRPISPGAEKWLFRPISCLDHGFVVLKDYLGNDSAIVEAARVSYGKGTKSVNEDIGLIRYLRRHLHTTPSEMVEFKFQCKMPIFVARQWIRHRTASVNEYSGRYSEMPNEFYLPDEAVLRKQSPTNKQGRADDLTPANKKKVLEALSEVYGLSFDYYENFLKSDIGLAKELARIHLPLATYTEWYWKIDLHNLMHFLALRLDSHAQHEIQVFGQAMARIINDSVPIAYKAFEDYTLTAMRLSGPEIEFIKNYQLGNEDSTRAEILEKFKNRRETDELMEKLEKLGFF
ncbi:MAG: FAD-dependent thymidylate synthase [Patescibacteria group bacterium]